MEIKPFDLGIDRAVTLLGNRASAYQASQPRRRMGIARNLISGKPKSLGLLGRFWTQGLSLSEEEAKEALGAASNIAGGFGLGFGVGSIGFFVPALLPLIASKSDMPPAFGIIFGAMGVAFASTGVLGPKAVIKKLVNATVSVGEIDGLLPAVQDPLEKSFLTLVQDALRQTNLSEQAATDLRSAIKSLGEAIDRLPPISGNIDTTPETLRREAAEVQAKADAEPDRVIADSLSRRAEALERSALAVNRSALLIRRTVALREELAAQTEALRLGLTAFYTGGGDVGELAELSESVRSVAAEAISVASAREEMETISPMRYNTSPATETPQPLTLGQR